MAIPKQYAWLATEGGPLMLTAGLATLGTLEMAGSANNPTIMDWAEEVGESVERVYLSDAIPWCGLWLAVVCKRGQKKGPKEPLWALNWGSFGVYSPTPGLGDVLVFTRPGGGHVGLYIGEDSTHFHVLGGNQNNSVSITRIPKKQLYTARRPAYKSQPKNVRAIKLAATGAVATSLA